MRFTRVINKKYLCVLSSWLNSNFEALTYQTDRENQEMVLK